MVLVLTIHMHTYVATERASSILRVNAFSFAMLPFICFIALHRVHNNNMSADYNHFLHTCSIIALLFVIAL